MTKTRTLTPESFTKDVEEQVNSQYGEELIKRDEIDNTPFMIITTRGVSFGAFGRYKITDDYLNPEQVRTELSKITWNRIIQIMSIVHQMLENQKPIE